MRHPCLHDAAGLVCSVRVPPAVLAPEAGEPLVGRIAIATADRRLTPSFGRVAAYLPSTVACFTAVSLLGALMRQLRSVVEQEISASGE